MKFTQICKHLLFNKLNLYIYNFKIINYLSTTIFIDILGNEFL